MEAYLIVIQTISKFRKIEHETQNDNCPTIVPLNR